MPANNAKKKAKTDVATVASARKTASAKKMHKEGPIGSLKKMLGIGASHDKKSSHKAPKAEQRAIEKTSMKHKTALKKSSEKVAPIAAIKGNSHGVSKEAVISAKPSKAEKKATAQAAREAAHGAAVCREVACELMCTTGGYCRMHYIKNWKKIKRKEIILKEKKLNSYIEELVSKYPDKYIEAIRQDLASEKDFAKVISDLEIEEGLDEFESVDTESAEGIIDNLKREFEDDGDVF